MVTPPELFRSRGNDERGDESEDEVQRRGGGADAVVNCQGRLSLRKRGQSNPSKHTFLGRTSTADFSRARSKYALLAKCPNRNVSGDPPAFSSTLHSTSFDPPYFPGYMDRDRPPSARLVFRFFTPRPSSGEAPHLPPP